MELCLFFDHNFYFSSLFPPPSPAPSCPPTSPPSSPPPPPPPPYPALLITTKWATAVVALPHQGFPTAQRAHPQPRK